MIGSRFASTRTFVPRLARVCATVAGIVLVAGCATTPSGPDTAACQRIDDAGIEQLFRDWNTAIQSGNVERVVDLYAPDSLLLPTLSREPRITRARKVAYFEEFLALGPVGHMGMSVKFKDCNIAVNAGTYTFTFERKPPARARFTYTYGWDAAQRRWLITSHHSSAEPQNPLDAAGDAAASGSGFETPQ